MIREGRMSLSLKQSTLSFHFTDNDDEENERTIKPICVNYPLSSTAAYLDHDVVMKEKQRTQLISFSLRNPLWSES